MKRIFPIIAILITLSLLGLIFFQFMWLKSAKELKLKRLRDNIIVAVGNVAYRLVEERVPFVPIPRKNEILLPTNKRTLDIFNSSVTARFTMDEIRYFIRQEMDKDEDLRNVPFEFAIGKNTIVGESAQSEHFYEYYQDSLRNFRQIALLLPESGGINEGLTDEETLVVIVPHYKGLVLQDLTPFFVGAILFTLIITSAFFITIRTLIRQKKLSEIKNDFINNMTHEFKTPIATVSLAVDALKNEKVRSDAEKTAYFTNIIKEENIRMNKQVEAILQAALLDKNEVQLNLKTLSAHHLIETALNNIALPVAEKNGKLNINLQAQRNKILADEVHFTNLINSLLDNAVKYSKGNPEITLTTSNTGNQLKIQIEDNGIGMNRETLSKIFEKFYRAHTGNVHNVKGFGLGLSYVKTMVEAHKGTIKAESTPGKGSIFTISVPLAE